MIKGDGQDLMCRRKEGIEGVPANAVCVTAGESFAIQPMSVSELWFRS